MNYKKQVVDAGILMLEKGWTLETWGNISIRDTESQLVYLTPSSMPYPEITEDDIIVADLNGNIIEGTRKPTIEMGLHLGIYRGRPDVNAIMHAHPIDSLVFGVLREDIPPIIDEAAQILGDCVPITNYALPGSDELAKECIEKLGKNRMAVIMAAHGSLCVGNDIAMAFKVSAVLEMTAKVYTMARSIGVPQTIDLEYIDYMHKLAYHKEEGKS